MLRRLFDWLKYNRLAHYPALAAFDRAAALERLRKYEREERAAIWPWPWVGAGVLAVLYLAFDAVVWLRGYPVAMLSTAGLPFFICSWIMQYAIHRRVKRRVNAKIAAELGDGRLKTCFECGYDVRVAEERCSECGASIRVEAVRLPS